MNRLCYRIVFNRARAMLMAVAETASSHSDGQSAGTRLVRHATRLARAEGPEPWRQGSRFAVPAIVLAVWVCTGLPMTAAAQVVADPNAGAHRPTVGQTANGLPQVDITRPSGAGVSTNAYTQFDVPRGGVILNNSPTITATQQAGLINGNPNLLPGGSARIIVNQVTSTLPSQLRGYLEVAGPRSEVIVANPNGILVDGAGFINTSRATLTTGVPVYGGSGSLDAFRVTGGQIAIQGDGLRAAGIDQVDLIARAVQANAALYADRLNVVAGANQVSHDTLAATPIAGSGPAPALGIDVAQLDGMYANKILLASTEHGVGVSLRGVTAAQAGDLTLTTQGRLVMTGRASASGNVAVSARDGIEHSGTTYGAQAVALSTEGDFANSGTLGAQRALEARAASVNASGTFAAGVNADGTAAAPADLTIVATNGLLRTTGRHQASGNARLQGVGIGMAGAQTSTGGSLTLQAGAADLDLTGAKTTAGTTLTAQSGGGLTHDRGQMSSQGAASLAAGSLSNVGGQIVAQGTATLQSTGGLDNRQGTIQAGGALASRSAAMDNTGGRAVSLNGDGLSIETSGALTNQAGTTANGAQGGVIGGNGDVRLHTGALANHGQITAQGDARIDAASLDNDTGNLSAKGALKATVAGALGNRQGTISGGSVDVAAQTLDNRAGTLEGSQLRLDTTGDVLNRGGRISQYGQADTNLSTGGKLDNAGGTLAANGKNLTIHAGGGLANDRGTIAHAGMGRLAVQSDGALTNTRGKVQTNGDLRVQATALDNTQGTLAAQRVATVAASGDLGNRAGLLYGRSGLVVEAGGALDNAGGSAQTDGELSVAATGAIVNTDGVLAANGGQSRVSISAASVDNTRGAIGNSGSGATTVNATTTLTNTAGRLGGNGDVTVRARSLANDAAAGTAATLAAGGALNLDVAGAVDNRGGKLFGGKGLTLDQAGATLDNAGGQVLGGTDVRLDVASLGNAGGAIKANRDVAVGGVVSGNGEMIAGRNLSLDVKGDYIHDAANKLRADGDMRVSATGILTNTGTLAAVGGLTVRGTDIVNAAGAGMNGETTTVDATRSLTNAGRIEGDTVLTNSPTTSNTGTIVGNNVTVQGGDLTNDGTSALIAAVKDLNIHARNTVRNLDGATLYSAGNLRIARDGTRDANTGLLTNQIDSLINRSANIEAERDIDIAAREVGNTRTRIEVEAGTPTSTSKTLTLWQAGLTGPELNNHTSLTFPGWTWHTGRAQVSTPQTNALRAPITVTVEKSTVTQLDTSKQTLSFTQSPIERYVGTSPGPNCDLDAGICTRPIATNATQYYQSIKDNGNGTYSITLWPDWDPSKHIRPDQVRQQNFGTDYNEISRTTVTTTATDRLVAAADPAKIQAGGTIRINGSGGNILNQSSTMAAGGNLIRVANDGGIQDKGTALQQTVTTQESSTFYWHQRTGGDSKTQVVAFPTTPQTPTTVMALSAVASANQTVQTSARMIDVATVNRQGETVTGSGIAGGSATGTQVAATSASQGKPPQTLGAANGGIPNLRLPTNGLYTYRTAPGDTYLVATDPRFTQFAKFISSDYMLGQLGLDPLKIQKRLGDGFYEEKLVRDQVTQLTGRTFLAGFSNNLDEYQALMDNGVAIARAFNLTPGIGLSAEQMAQLTTDMVWLVNQDVTLPDGTRQSVLVPKLYLAQANAVDLQASGALVTGKQVSLNATGDVANSGRIVGDVATQVMGENIVNRGRIGEVRTTVLAARQDVQNLGGRIAGTDTLVSAGRDVVNASQTITNTTTLANGNSASATAIGSLAAISGRNNVAVLAGRDIGMTGGSVSAGKDAALAAGRDLSLGTTATGTTQDATAHGGRDYLRDRTVTGAGSAVQAGGNVTAVTGRDATLTGSTVQAGGDAALLAGRNATVTASLDSHTHDAGAFSNKRSQHTVSSYDETARGSTVQAGNNATIGAGQAVATSILQANGITPAATEPGAKGNLEILGSSVTTGGANSGGGAAKLAASGDVTVGTVTEQHSADSWSQTRKSGFLSKSQTTTQSSQQQAVAVGSLISADSVAASAGRDLTVSGSSVAGTGNVSLHADRDLNIGAAQSTASASTSQETRKSGLFSSGGASVTLGKQQVNQSQTTQSTIHTGSVVGSVAGNVNLSAGETYSQTGSAVTALQGDVDIRGKTVDIGAATDTSRMDQETRFKQSGLTVAVSNPILAAAQTGVQMAQAQGQTSDPRMKALAGAATGLAGKNAYDAASKDPAAAGGINVSVTLGASKSESRQTQQSTTAIGSQVSAGRDVRVQATGGGEASNVNVVGSDIKAGNDLVLKADHQVNLQAAANTAEQHNTSKSASAGVGVAISYGAGGTSVGVTANASAARGKADGSDVAWTNSHATAGHSLKIESGGDTNLRGAAATGEQVVANIGGDLNVESLQDTSKYRSKDQSAGGSVTVGGGFAGSANLSQQKIHSDFASVGEQSAIRAGSGGYQIDVAGNTDLKGAVIAGGSADKSRLSTGTLTTSDIRNHAEYSASSVGLGGGFSSGGSSQSGKSGVGVNQGGEAATAGSGAVPGTELPTTGRSGQGFSAAPPMVAAASGSASSTTQSGISAGAITIRDDAKQQALTGKTGADTVASLNRNTTNTENSLSPIFNAEEIKAGFQIVGALQRESGVFLNNRANEAEAAKKAAEAAATDPTVSPERLAALQQQSDDLAKWGQGGKYRQVMTALTAAAGGNVTGSTAQFVQSAAVGYLQGLAANQVKDLADSIGKGTPGAEAARAALHAIVGCAGAAAASQACGAGAMGAATASVLGSLLSPTDGMTAQQKQARENVIQSLVAGVAGTTGANAATFEIENNQLSQSQSSGGLIGLIQKVVKGQAAIHDGLASIGNDIKQVLQNGPQAPLISPDDLGGSSGTGSPPPTAPAVVTAAVPCAPGALCPVVIATPGSLGSAPGNAILADDGAKGNNSRLPIPEPTTGTNGLQVESNPKHTTGMLGNRPNAGTEPANSLDLFNSSVAGGDGVRYAIDSNGNINRFYSDGNGIFHWSGSTGDQSAPLNVSKIPIDVKRTLGFKGK